METGKAPLVEQRGSFLYGFHPASGVVGGSMKTADKQKLHGNGAANQHNQKCKQYQRQFPCDFLPQHFFSLPFLFFRGLQAIAPTPQGLNQALAFPQFFPETLHCGVHGAGIAFVIKAPDHIQNLFL